jgi:hypothetical protein
VEACRGHNALLCCETVWSLLRDAFMNRAIYVMGCVKFTKDLTAYGLMFWAPVLIRGLRHHHQTGENQCETWEHAGKGANATGYVEVLLTGIPYTGAAIMSLLFAWNSQVCSPMLLFTLISLGFHPAQLFLTRAGGCQASRTWWLCR